MLLGKQVSKAKFTPFLQKFHKSTPIDAMLAVSGHHFVFFVRTDLFQFVIFIAVFNMGVDEQKSLTSWRHSCDDWPFLTPIKSDKSIQRD
uniref:Uncharacterized protein n=1 Tax=Romanomermis culicivorax TaxID=13658 RepID=A0A915IHB6_ROMCU